MQISGDTIAGFRKPWTYTNTLSNEYPIVAYVIKFTVNSVGALSVSTSEYESIEDTEWAKMWQQRASSDDSRINVNYINILNYLDLVWFWLLGMSHILADHLVKIMAPLHIIMCRLMLTGIMERHTGINLLPVLYKTPDKQAMYHSNLCKKLFDCTELLGMLKGDNA